MLSSRSQDNLRKALVNSKKWRDSIKSFDIMTIAFFPPMNMSMWTEEDETDAYLWIEGKMESIPRKINEYLLRMVKYERKKKNEDVNHVNK